jgi:hypothetical protein
MISRRVSIISPMQEDINVFPGVDGFNDLLLFGDIFPRKVWVPQDYQMRDIPPTRG